MLSPIVWMHYFTLLFVAIALARRAFGAIWLLPALFWITPDEEFSHDRWRIGVGIAIATAILLASWRPMPAATERMTPET